jgi:hypothetical protein
MFYWFHILNFAVVFSVYQIILFHFKNKIPMVKWGIAITYTSNQHKSFNNL